MPAQSPADILAHSAGHEVGEQLARQHGALSRERFREGFERGVHGDRAELAYALGLSSGIRFRVSTPEGTDMALFLTGVFDGLQMDPPRHSAAQVQAAREAQQEDLLLRDLEARGDPKARRMVRLIRENRAASDALLARVTRLPGVTTSESGLLSLVTQAGDGSKPAAADEVEYSYVGRLPDGTVFSQSPETGSATSPLYALIPGVAEALQAMRAGERRTVWLPPVLAYGFHGAPGPGGQGGIPPNSVLEFDLTLVRVLPAGDDPM